MNTFILHLLDSHGARQFDQVKQFIGADNSGSFGLLAGHAKMVAVLRYGLARFVDASGKWQYLSLPGGVLNFSNNELTLVTVRYFLGEDRTSICQLLADEMVAVDSDIHHSHATLVEIEHALIRRLGELGGQEHGGGLRR